MIDQVILNCTEVHAILRETFLCAITFNIFLLKLENIILHRTQGVVRVTLGSCDVPDVKKPVNFNPMKHLPGGVPENHYNKLEMLETGVQ